MSSSTARKGHTSSPSNSYSRYKRQTAAPRPDPVSASMTADTAAGEMATEIAPQAASAAVLPFGMRLAPVRARVTAPIDMGRYDATYAGWLVVYDMTVDLSVYRKMSELRNANQVVQRAQATQEAMEAAQAAQAGGQEGEAEALMDQMMEQMASTVEWLERILVSWNFAEIDSQGFAVPLPQPRAGGAWRIPLPLIGPVTQGFFEHAAPKANSGRR